MEMVLEYLYSPAFSKPVDGFNPSSNGNGAGIKTGLQFPETWTGCFNPSSNGNGAGI